MRRIDQFLFTLILLLVALGGLPSCHDEPTGATAPNIHLTLEDVSCTEAWLRVHVAAGLLPDTLTVTRNDSTVLSLKLSQTDTLLIDEQLLPNRQYSYRARLMGGSGNWQSDPFIVTTMDTTSHNFTFQVETLGDGAGSVLYDVAIINDTLAYAVGEINVKDSLGNWLPRYNAAKWDGHTWIILRVPYYYRSDSFYNPIQAVFAFSEDNVWFAGNGVIKWNGKRFEPIEIPSSVWGPYLINKIWGSSSENLYVVGNGGHIAHYDGRVWRKLESGTTRNINDVWGVPNALNGEQQIFCAVTAVADPWNSRILRIRNGTEIGFVEWTTGRELMSVWTTRGYSLYACGDGVFENRLGEWKEIQLGIGTFASKVRGTESNDIFVVGSFGVVAHFNGLSWNVRMLSGTYASVDAKAGLVSAVDWRGESAVAIVGRR